MSKLFYLKYLNYQPVEIDTLYIGDNERKGPLKTVYQLIMAAVSEPTKSLLGLPKDFGPLSLHSFKGEPLESDLNLSELNTGLIAKDALIIKSLNYTGQDILNDLTTQLKSFDKAQLAGGYIQAENQYFIPYPQEKIKKLFVRKCYEDIFDLLLEKIKNGSISFAISGTSGIGKSLFFIYILFRLMKDFKSKTLALKPKLILYQIRSTFECFDLEQLIVRKTKKFEAEGLVREQDTLYIIDGQEISLPSSCITLFISSARPETYKSFVKQSKAKQWYFPVWTFEELSSCSRSCYDNLNNEILKERYLVYGGVARSVFHIYYSTIEMEGELSDVNAVKQVRKIRNPTKIFEDTHTLLHIIVSDDGQYNFRHVDVASKYVAVQLWKQHSAEMIVNLQEMFGGSPNVISRHLFEIYGHQIFSSGGMKLKCKCLEDYKMSEITLDALNSNRATFGKDNIPTVAQLDGSYYEPADDDNFPAIDSLTKQGMFQFTVASEHPIRGIDILKKLCALYDEPKIYFVVPPHKFESFKKQHFQQKKGEIELKSIPKMKQYVLELPVLQNPEMYFI